MKRRISIIAVFCLASATVAVCRTPVHTQGPVTVFAAKQTNDLYRVDVRAENVPDWPFQRFELRLRQQDQTTLSAKLYQMFPGKVNYWATVVEVSEQEAPRTFVFAVYYNPKTEEYRDFSVCMADVIAKAIKKTLPNKLGGR